MKAAQFAHFGDPAEVLSVREIAEPPLASGQVRVRMIAAPINPSDLLVVRGQYGKLPALPATPGFEGVGVVEASGGGILGWRVNGKRVAVIHGLGGTWQETVVIPAKQAVPVPNDIPDEQAASFFVNPATVVAMIERVLQVPRGAWLLQTAAFSALGRMVIRLGRHAGFRTINVVRRAEQVDELKRLGADEVIDSSQASIEERVLLATKKEGVRYALDAVGGDAGSAVIRSLAPDGCLLLYGTLSGQPIQIDPRVLMVGRKRVEGFWLSEWARRQGPLTMLGLFRRIISLLRAGVLVTPVGESFPLEQVTSAVRSAAEPGRDGKVLLRLR